MDNLVKIFKALGDKNRLRILKMLQHRSLCVCEITAILELATSTVSQHLSVLKDAELIGDIKDGKWVDHYLLTESKNIFIAALLPHFTFWLNRDEQVISDITKLKTTHRTDLCK